MGKMIVRKRELEISIYGRKDRVSECGIELTPESWISPSKPDVPVQPITLCPVAQDR